MQTFIGYILAALIGGGAGFGAMSFVGDGWAIFGGVIGFLLGLYVALEVKKQDSR